MTNSQQFQQGSEMEAKLNKIRIVKSKTFFTVKRHCFNPNFKPWTKGWVPVQPEATCGSMGANFGQMGVILATYHVVNRVMGDRKILW